MKESEIKKTLIAIFISTCIGWIGSGALFMITINGRMDQLATEQAEIKTSISKINDYLLTHKIAKK